MKNFQSYFKIVKKIIIFSLFLKALIEVNWSPNVSVFSRRTNH